MKRSYAYGAMTCFAVVFMGLSSLVKAQESKRVGADQILADALAHSLSVKAAEQERFATDARRVQADAKGLPSLDVDMRAGRFNGLEDSSLGPTLTLPAIEGRYAAGIVLTQPLFTGGQITHQKQSATFQQQAAAARVQSTTADVALQTLQTYWAWSKSFHVLASLQSALARIDAHAVDMRNLEQSGLATVNDRLATEVLRDQTSLKLQEASRATALARARIAFLTGFELPDAAVPDNPAVAESVAVPEEHALLVDAVTNRAECVVRRKEFESADEGVGATRAGYVPKLYLTAHYEQMRPNSYFFPPEDRWNDDAFAGVVMTWNIFDSGLTRAAVKEAEAKRQTASLMLAQTEELITLQVKESRINLQNALDRCGVAVHAENSAAQNLKTVTDQWQNGLSRHSEVLDAHARLTQAQYDVIAARADAALARSALDHAVGRLALAINQ